MIKVKILRYTTDIHGPVTVVENAIEEWLQEHTGVTIVYISGSSRETMDRATPVLAWDIIITYRYADT